MIDNENIFIHLGLHKTATTFFQKSFYPSHPEFNYKHLRDKAVLAEFNQYLLRENELSYDINKAKTLFFKNIDTNDVISGILTLCEEQYSGFPLQNAYNRKIIFDRLHAFFPNANYILVLRNQKEFIKSMYAEYLKKGGTANLQNFLTRNDSQISFAKGSYLQYGAYYSYIKNNIPTNKIKILYFEDLKNQPTLFYKNLLEFFKMDIKINHALVNKKINISHSSRSFESQRFFNKIGKTPYGKDHLISNRYKDIIMKIHQLFFGSYLNEVETISHYINSMKFDNSQLPEYERIKNYGY